MRVPEPSLAAQTEVFAVGQRHPLAARPLSLDCMSLLGTHYPTAKGGQGGQKWLNPDLVGRATMRQRAELAEGGFAMACIGHLLNTHLPQHPGLKTGTALCKEKLLKLF